MCQIWLRSDRRECNAGMTIAKCTKTAASSNVSNHLSRTPIARFASGAAHHARPYRNLGRRISLRSYTIVGGTNCTPVRIGPPSPTSAVMKICRPTSRHTDATQQRRLGTNIFRVEQYWQGFVSYSIAMAKRYGVRTHSQSARTCVVGLKNSVI